MTEIGIENVTELATRTRDMLQSAVDSGDADLVEGALVHARSMMHAAKRKPAQGRRVQPAEDDLRRSKPRGHCAPARDAPTRATAPRLGPDPDTGHEHMLYRRALRSGAIRADMSFEAFAAEQRRRDAVEDLVRRNRADAVLAVSGIDAADAREDLLRRRAERSRGGAR